MDKVERKYLEELLYQILKSKEPKKSLLIHKFQNYVWNDEIFRSYSRRGGYLYNFWHMI